MIKPRSCLVLCMLPLLAMTASAQQYYVGYHRYPQFRTWSGLPGGGYGLTPDGQIDPNGALAYSTPVAYSLGQGEWVIGAGVVAGQWALQWFEKGEPGPQQPFAATNGGNGTGVISTGFNLGNAGMITASTMVLSGLGDTAFNFQYSPGIQVHKLRYAVGVQDLHGGGGASGNGEPGDLDSSTSFYGAATYDFDANGTFLTAGDGTHRFGKGFANLSTNLLHDTKGYVEFDGWNFNSGVTYALPVGRWFGEQSFLTKAQLQFSLGEAAGQYLYWGVFLTL